MDTFSYFLNTFSVCSSQSNPHSKNLFLILRNTRFHNDSIYGLLLLSRAPQDSIDTTVSKLFISSSVYIQTAKNGCGKKGIFYLVP